jgi:F-type H+-transporting ATPase subunit delta
MSNIPVARRYARALLDLAGTKADEMLEQMEALSGFLEGQPEIASAVSSPALSRAQRSSLVSALAKAIPALSPTVVNLLKLLTDRNRFDSVAAITRQFRDLVDARLGRVRGQVSSATKLGADQVAAITASLETMTKHQVLLETKIDKALLGGVVAQVGSKLYDGSLRSQLKAMGQRLSQPIV